MNIAVIIPDSGANQIAFYAIKEMNRLVDNKFPHDLTIFFENLASPIIKPKCATMCINELSAFNGNIITTTIDTTTMAIARNGSIENKILFYVWDLEWLRPNKNIYLYNYNAFNKADSVIARSDIHAKAIENYSNRKTDKIVSIFNIIEIVK